MTEISTKSKVTKLNDGSVASCNTNETTISESDIIKNEAQTENASATKESKASSSLMQLKNKAIGLFASINNKIKCLFAKAVPLVKSKTGIKVIITSCLAIACFTLCAFTCSFGYNIYINGDKIGTVLSKEKYYTVCSDINDNVFAMTGKEFTVSDDVKFSFTFTPNRNFHTDDILAENIKSTSTEMIPAYAIVIDGDIITALANQAMATDVINEYKAALAPEHENTELEFSKNVEVCYMFTPKSLLRTKDSAVNLLKDGKYSYYKTDRNMTVSEFAEENNIPEKTVKGARSVNGNIIPKDSLLKLYSGEMFVDVKAVSRVQREEAIPYETIKQDSDEIYQGITKVETPGIDGIKEIDEYISYTNGVETSRNIISESTLKAPTNQVELVGTKEPPPSVGTGSLAMPTSGSLSSRFGSRWGRQHKGIDLSAPEGTPIYAADNGTVVYSEYNNGGYGYMIQIDHGNGITTYYAHCSELFVEVGEVVAKGDLIANVGNTGRSTGAHLHFEVRQDGQPIDPLTYIN